MLFVSMPSRISHEQKAFLWVGTNQVYMNMKKGTFEPIDGAMLQHNAKIIIRFEKLADGKRRAVLLKHRSLPEGREALFTITQNGIE